MILSMIQRTLTDFFRDTLDQRTRWLLEGKYKIFRFLPSLSFMRSGTMSPKSPDERIKREGKP